MRCSTVARGAPRLVYRWGLLVTPPSLQQCRPQANNLRPGISSVLCPIPSAPPVSHIFFSLVFPQVAADFQVFRALQQPSACGCQSRCPQGGDGGGCQQSGDLPGICSPCSSLLGQAGDSVGVVCVVQWGFLKTLLVMLQLIKMSKESVLSSDSGLRG